MRQVIKRAKEFEWTKIAQQTLDLYNEILEERKKLDEQKEK